MELLALKLGHDLIHGGFCRNLQFPPGAIGIITAPAPAAATVLANTQTVPSVPVPRAAAGNTRSWRPQSAAGLRCVWPGVPFSSGCGSPAPSPRGDSFPPAISFCFFVFDYCLWFGF